MPRGGKETKTSKSTPEYESHETYVSVPGYESVAGTVKPRFLSQIQDKKLLKTTPEESYKSSGIYETAFPNFEDEVKDSKQFLKIDDKSVKYRNKNVSGDSSGALSKNYIDDHSITPTPIPGSHPPSLTDSFVATGVQTSVNNEAKNSKLLASMNMQTAVSENPNDEISKNSRKVSMEELVDETKTKPKRSRSRREKTGRKKKKTEQNENDEKRSNLEEYRSKSKQGKESESDLVEVKDVFSRSKSFSAGKDAPSSPNNTDRGPRMSDAKYIDPSRFRNRSSGRNPSSKLSENEVIDWNVAENREINFTKHFDEKYLIVRRGFPIKFMIAAGKLERVKLYNIPSKNENQETEPPRNMIEIALTLDKPTFAGWSLKDSDGNFIIKSAANCIIGLWLLKIRISGEDYRKEMRILFNPWCADDEVFLEEEELREEYVLSENGRLFTFKEAYFPWFYGQFEHRILDIVLYLLEKSNLSSLSKSSAVLVARAMSHVIVYDEKEVNGVVTGKWQEPYTGGYDPKHWNNSVEILNKYYKTRRQVSYGQCWVFSAVLITAMRALGIPSRAVTNECSFHDSSSSNICEWEVLNDGSVKRLDQVWNFHVWIEVWMKRDDLPRGYGGWQALDATPQEMSEGVSRAGPASVKAIKEAALYLPYDTAFLFSEINSDLVFWKRDKTGQLEKILKIDTGKIGKLAVTKEVSKWNPEDITVSYKFNEDSSISTKQRLEILQAVNPGASVEMYEKFYNHESKLGLKLNAPDYIALGNDFEFSVEVKSNETLSSSQADITVTIFVSTNTGKFIGQVLKREHKQIDLSKCTPLKMRIEYGKYRRFAGSGYFVKFFATCHLKKPFEAIDCDYLAVPFHCSAPDIKVLSMIPYIQGVPVDIKLSFVNEFRFGLSGCYFELWAPRMKPKAFGIKKGLASGESCYLHLQYKPKRSGEVMLIAKFGCREIAVMSGSTAIDVLEKSIDPT